MAFSSSLAFFALLSVAAPEKQQLQTPLYFEPNLGQFDSRIRFLARGPVYRAWITDSELILESAADTARSGLASPSKTPRQALGIDQQVGVSSYFIGNRPERWRQNVPSYAQARINEIYKGIDVVFYATANQQQIEYDLIVKPGADPSQISIDFDPRFRPRLDPKDPALVTMNLPRGELRHRVPKVHQRGSAVPYQAVLNGNSLRFELGTYDRAETLTVDPVVIFATYTGGPLSDIPAALAIDPSGAGAFLAGQTKSIDHTPLLFESLPRVSGNDFDCFVTKYEVSGSASTRIYSTYLGGERGDDCTGLAVDSTGAAYVGGTTSSTQFPVRAAHQATQGPMFVAKISGAPTAGTGHTLVYSTYLYPAGPTYSNRVGLAVDAAGAAYIASVTAINGFATSNAPQSNWGGDWGILVTKLSGTASAGVYGMVYTTYVGGSGAELNPSIAVNAAGSAFVAGKTSSTNFPVVNALQSTLQAGQECGFVTRLPATPNGSGIFAFEYSTYLCGTSGGDQINAIGLDSASNAYVTGRFFSPDFPLLNSLPESPSTGFVAKISGVKTGNSYPLLMSSRFGGQGRSTTPAAISVAADRSTVAIVGETRGNSAAASFAQVDPPFEAPYGDLGAFAVKFNLVSRTTTYSTVLGFGNNFGVAMDPAGNTFIGGKVSNFGQEIYNGHPVETPGILMKLGTQPSPVTVTVGLNTGALVIRINVAGEGCRAGTYMPPVSFRWPAGRACTVSLATPQESTSVRYLFKRWNDGSTSTSRSVTATTTTTNYQLEFEEEYRISTDVIPPGAGTTTPAVSQFYKAGTRLELTATPNPGYAFLTWLDSSVTNFGFPNASLVVAHPNQIVALFAPAPIRNDGLVFVPITPCRAADTRNPAGPLGQPALAAKATRSFPLPQSSCGIPANAAAYSLNVTVVPKGGLGYLSIWPTGASQPVVSTLNALDGRIKANAAIVPAETGGAISVYVTDETEAILDVNGYFILPPRTDGLVFYPVAPCRIIDTRLANGALGGPALEAVTTRTIPIRSSSCGIPATAKAYSLNSTVVPQGPLGFLSMWPTGSTRPLVSTLNALTGTVTANAAIIPAGSDGAGSVDVYATDRTHLILDVNGYFAPPSGTEGQKFYTMTPCRIYDSRTVPNSYFPGPLASERAQGYLFEMLSVSLFGAPPKHNCNVSAAAKSYSLSTTVVPRGPFGFLTIYPDTPAAPLPTVSILNAVDGAITSNAAILPGGAIGRVIVYATDPTDLLIDINGYFAP